MSTPERGYTYTMISSKPGNDQIGHVHLEPLGPNRTRFEFDERYNLTSVPFRWFEGQIYSFINKKNEESMRRGVGMADRASGVPGRPHRSGQRFQYVIFSTGGRRAGENSSPLV